MNKITNLKEIPLTSSTKGVIFDCFGTLLEIKNKQKPYKYLSIELAKKGFTHDNYAKWIMSNPLEIQNILKESKITLEKEVIDTFNRKLKEEVESITLYPETIEVLSELKKQGIKIALCSNLAMPYGRVKEILPQLDDYFLSYELNMIKPNQDLFAYCEKTINLKKEELIYVGDSIKDDYEGASLYGFNTYLIKRSRDE